MAQKSDTADRPSHILSAPLAFTLVSSELAVNIQGRAGRKHWRRHPTHPSGLCFFTLSTERAELPKQTQSRSEVVETGSWQTWARQVPHNNVAPPWHLFLVRTSWFNILSQLVINIPWNKIQEVILGLENFFSSLGSRSSNFHFQSI